MANRAPTTDEQEPEPATTNTTEARQEGSALAKTNPTQEQQTENTTLPELGPTCKSQQEALATPHSAATPTSPTPPQPPIAEPTSVPTSEEPSTDQNENHKHPRTSSSYTKKIKEPIALFLYHVNL